MTDELTTVKQAQEIKTWAESNSPVRPIFRAGEIEKLAQDYIEVRDRLRAAIRREDGTAGALGAANRELVQLRSQVEALIKPDAKPDRTDT